MGFLVHLSSVFRCDDAGTNAGCDGSLKRGFWRAVGSTGTRYFGTAPGHCYGFWFGDLFENLR